MKRATDTDCLLIAVVRADEKVGRGTCSSIDETFTDDELLDLLRWRGALTAAQAVNVAREHEELYRRGENDIQAEAF